MANSLPNAPVRLPNLSKNSDVRERASGRILATLEAEQCPLWVFSGILTNRRYVRFSPDSGHSSVQVGCPKSAISRHSCRAFDLNRADSRGMRLGGAYSSHKGAVTTPR